MSNRTDDASVIIEEICALAQSLYRLREQQHLTNRLLCFLAQSTVTMERLKQMGELRETLQAQGAQLGQE